MPPPLDELWQEFRKLQRGFNALNTIVTGSTAIPSTGSTGGTGGGLPAGGAFGQFLMKESPAPQDAGWENIPGFSIPELPDASTLTGDELAPISQDGDTRKTTLQSIANLATPSTGGGGVGPGSGYADTLPSFWVVAGGDFSTVQGLYTTNWTNLGFFPGGGYGLAGCEDGLISSGMMNLSTQGTLVAATFHALLSPQSSLDTLLGVRAHIQIYDYGGIWALSAGPVDATLPNGVVSIVVPFVGRPTQLSFFVTVASGVSTPWNVSNSRLHVQALAIN